MNRRELGKAGLAAAVGMAAGSTRAGAVAVARSFYELRTYELRYGLDLFALNTFMEKEFIPAMKKHTGGPIGVFNVSQGQLSPALTVLIQYESLGQLLANTDLAARQDSFSKVWARFESSEMPYIRYHSVLLKSFAAHPQVEVPEKKSGSRLFELRTYESKDAVKSAAKIDMFNQEEIKIFRDCDMQPVFFGEGIFGPRLPLLTYMLAFDNNDHREKAWAQFRLNDDWNRIKDDPKWADTVSSIHASFLIPTGYSDIR